MDFMSLNLTCPKDDNPLIRIDTLFNLTMGYFLISFLDVFSGYHQIKIYLDDCEKETFITIMVLHCYKVMSFELKNIGAIYQKMMEKIFRDHKGRNIEVCVDDFLMKIKSPSPHIKDLKETFATSKKFM